MVFTENKSTSLQTLIWIPRFLFLQIYIVFFFIPFFFPKFLFLQIYSGFFISSPFIPLSLGDVRPPPKKHRSLDESNDQESELGLFCDLRPASCCIDYGAGGGGGRKGAPFGWKLWDANIIYNQILHLSELWALHHPLYVVFTPCRGRRVRFPQFRGLGFHRRSCLVGHGLGAGFNKPFRFDGGGPSVVWGKCEFLVEAEVDQSWDLYTLPETYEMIG